MIKHIGIEYVGTPDLVMADKKSITEDAMVGALRVWHRRFLLRHFYVSAEKKYKYGQRAKKYIAQKKAKYGHVNPLTKTGKMRRQLMSRFDTKTFNFKRKGKASGTMWANVLNLYSKPTAPQDIKREITEMVELEIAQLMRVVRKGVETRFKQSKLKRKVTVGL